MQRTEHILQPDSVSLALLMVAIYLHLFFRVSHWPSPSDFLSNAQPCGMLQSYCNDMPERQCTWCNIPCNHWWNGLAFNAAVLHFSCVDVSNGVQVSPRLIQNDAIGIQIQPEVITVDPTLINIGPNGAAPMLAPCPNSYCFF